MSLHLKTDNVKEPLNIKRRTAKASPIYTGGPAIRLCWRPNVARPVGNRQRRVGGAHLGGVRDSVNSLFAILLRLAEKTSARPLTGPLEMGGNPRFSRGQAKAAYRVNAALSISLRPAGYAQACPQYEQPVVAHTRETSVPAPSAPPPWRARDQRGDERI